MLTDPYSTHMPVLQAVGKLINPRRVLEFGTGIYSTLTFLNRNYYAGLVTLHAIENDPSWIERIKQLTDDRRLRYVEHPADLDGYDIIFVDNGQSDHDRMLVIRALVAAGVTGPVIIHDSELQQYRDAARFDNIWEWTGRRPATMVCWNGDYPELREGLDGTFNAN